MNKSTLKIIALATGVVAPLTLFLAADDGGVLLIFSLICWAACIILNGLNGIKWVLSVSKNIFLTCMGIPVLFVRLILAVTFAWAFLVICLFFPGIVAIRNLLSE